MSQQPSKTEVYAEIAKAFQLFINCMQYSRTEIDSYLIQNPNPTVQGLVQYHKKVVEDYLFMLEHFKQTYLDSEELNQ
jgi:hypothetical protein